MGYLGECIWALGLVERTVHLSAKSPILCDESCPGLAVGDNMCGFFEEPVTPLMSFGHGRCLACVLRIGRHGLSIEPVDGMIKIDVFVGQAR